FVARINGLAVLFGDEGMEDAGLEAGSGKGPLHEAVVTTGPFDGDEAVAELVGRKSLPDLGYGGIEVGTLVGDGPGRDEDATVEVSKEELGACLGAVEADDAEVFGSDALDAGVEHTAGFTDAGGNAASGGALTGTSRGHERSLQQRGYGSSHFGS